MLNVKQSYGRLGSRRRSGKKILGPKFIVAHDTGNIDSSAEDNVSFYQNPAHDTETSAHTFVDDKGAIEFIPDTEIAYHVRYGVPDDNLLYGLDANDAALGVELCYFTDKERSLKAYNNYCEYIALKCVKFNLNPKSFIVGHFRLDIARRTDPMNAFNRVGKTWSDFISDVLFFTKTTKLTEETVSVEIPKSKVDQVLKFLKSLF
jgi:N-acetylmuramoyl-L-alanine amidase CwlA